MNIRCRAKISARCEDGQEAWYDVTDDGTYDGPTQSVVCDECYFYLMPYTPSGGAMTYELNDAIIQAREDKVNGLVTEYELAKQLGTDVHVVRQNWAAWGLTGFPLGKMTRFRKNEIDEWLAKLS